MQAEQPVAPAGGAAAPPQASDAEAAEASVDAAGDDVAEVSDGKSVSDVSSDRAEAAPMLKIAIVVFVVIVSPLICRQGLKSQVRAALLIISVLLLNIGEVMPLYCTSLFIPVLGTISQVLGSGHNTVETSTLLVGNIFNNVSFMVLGALVINGIFVKCRLEKRLMGFLLAGVSPDNPIFVLMLLLGGMAVCSVLFSGSLVLISALEPLFKKRGKDALHPNVVKRLLLAIAYCSNAGSTWFPISSPVNLITIALLSEFDFMITLSHWVMVSIPVATLTMCGVWLLLIWVYPRSGEAVDEGPEHIADDTLFELTEEESDELSAQHYFFLFVGFAAVLLITVFATDLEPVIGHPACISLSVVVLAFGSGFMSREEFLQLDWDLLAIVGGTNVMAFVVRETGLAALVASRLVESPTFMLMDFWMILAVLVFGTMVVSTCSGHTLTGVLVLPLVIAVGVKLQAAETVAILVAIAVPMGMGMKHSSFDNVLSHACSRKLQRPRCELTGADFRSTGVPLSIWAGILLMLVGFNMCIHNYGHPPPVIIAETGTPEQLKPKVAKDNLPSETSQITWNRDMADWKAFMEKPDHKAFAVSELEPGMKTRAWAATWNHPTQEEANRRAIKDCEHLGRTCRVIYPAPESGRRGVSFLALESKAFETSGALVPLEGHASRRSRRMFAANIGVW